MDKDAGSALRSFVRRHAAAIAIASIFALYFLTRLVNLRGVPVFIDEAIYIKWAHQAQHGNLWASLLWDGKPPLHSWMMVPFLGAVKDQLLAGRLNSVFFGSLTTLGLFLTGRELRNWKLGAAAAFLYVACPFALWYDRLAIAESMMLALFVFAVFFAVKAAKTVNPRWLIGTGIATGLALLTKGTATLLYPIVFFAYFVRGPAEKGLEKSKPLLRWLGASGLALLGGFAMLNLERLSPVWAQRSHFITTRTKGIVAALATPLRTFLSFNNSILKNLYAWLTPVLLLLAVAGLVLSLIKRWRPGYFLWAWFVIGFAVISLVGKFEWARFYLVLVPPLLLAAAYALYELGAYMARAWSRAPGRKLLPSVSIAVVAALLMVAAMPAGSMMAGMVTAKTGEAEYLKGRCAGTGMKETAAMLSEAADHAKINVVVNDYFIQLALEMYMGNRPNVNVITLELEYRNGFSKLLEQTLDDAASKGPTYLVANFTTTTPPPGWNLVTLKTFDKDDGHQRSAMLVTEVPDDSPMNAGMNRQPL